MFGSARCGSICHMTCWPRIMNGIATIASIIVVSVARSASRAASVVYMCMIAMYVRILICATTTYHKRGYDAHGGY